MEEFAFMTNIIIIETVLSKKKKKINCIITEGHITGVGSREPTRVGSRVGSRGRHITGVGSKIPPS